MGLGNVSPALYTLDGLHVKESESAVVFEVYLYIGPWWANDIHINGQPVSAAREKQHQCGTALPDQGATGCRQQLYKGEGANDLLNEVNIRVMEVVGYFLYPFTGKTI
jgi:hypothetical protein